MKRPFFSIVVPTYNRATELKFALYSLLRQTFSDFEVVVSDNCSSDNTKEIVKSFRDKRIRYFKSRKNVSFLLNVKKSVQYAKGMFIFLHGDDDFIFDNTSLNEIFQKIKKNNPGYVRVNYLCLTPDKKFLFDFNVGKSLKKDKLIKPDLNNEEIISFIFDTDASFMSGVIFRNELTRSVNIINSGLLPWIDILFSNIKNYGGYFISKPHVIASWSQWVMRNNEPHHLYSLEDGKLAYESYFSFIEKKLSPESYRKFLNKRVMISFVSVLPAIKVYIGNKKMIELIKRLRIIDSQLNKSITFWIYFIFAYVLPRKILELLKNVYFQWYIKSSRVEDRKILNGIKNLKQEYLPKIEK